MGTDDAVCVDLRAVGGGDSDRLSGAQAQVLSCLSCLLPLPYIMYIVCMHGWDWVVPCIRCADFVSQLLAGFLT